MGEQDAQYFHRDVWLLWRLMKLMSVLEEADPSGLALPCLAFTKRLACLLLSLTLH